MQRMLSLKHLKPSSVAMCGPSAPEPSRIQLNFQVFVPVLLGEDASITKVAEDRYHSQSIIHHTLGTCHLL